MAEMDEVSAQAEFDSWVESWDLDLSPDDDVDGKDLEGLQRTVIRGLKSGRLAFDESSGVMTLNPQFSGGLSPLVFNVPKAGAYMKLTAGKAAKDPMRGIFAFMAEMTSVNPAVIAQQLDGRDLKFAQALVSLFMSG